MLASAASIHMPYYSNDDENKASCRPKKIRYHFHRGFVLEATAAIFAAVAIRSLLSKVTAMLLAVSLEVSPIGVFSDLVDIISVTSRYTAVLQVEI